MHSNNEINIYTVLFSCKFGLLFSVADALCLIAKMICDSVNVDVFIMSIYMYVTTPAMGSATLGCLLCFVVCDRKNRNMN